ncbi:MAG: hypothetical protein ACJAQ0_001651, partial [Dasania sp.]
MSIEDNYQQFRNTTAWDYQNDGLDKIKFSDFEEKLKNFHTSFGEGTPNPDDINYMSIGRAINSYGYDISDYRMGRYVDNDDDGTISGEELSLFYTNAMGKKLSEE